MKKLLTSFAAFTALTAAATAADLPRRAAPPVFVPVPVFTWTGFYAGFNAGYGFDAGNDVATPAVVATGASGIFRAPGLVGGNGAVIYNNSRSQEGFTGGGQIGYNYQFTPGSGFVIGVEADAQYVDFGRDRNRVAGFVGTPNPDLTFVNPNGISSLDYFGTVRGRIGYAFDRVLFYGTGGFAYGAGSAERSFGGFRGNDDFRTGYAAGGGIEYALPTDSFLNFFRSSAVTLKVEGLYVNLDRTAASNVFAVSNSTGLQFRTGTPYATATGGTRGRDTEFAVVRAGLNYKFGSY
ncbi:porin [Methylobacterium sp. Leaf469]|jgi:outer membrane immunogenic protein|uniref:outer membrane protein n=1 Tax=unclassified Methylobacterium TaxID=2615210 RepID=UPI0006FAAF27|nr:MULTISPECIES: porin family protein [unclassified Methylobacterium]USU33101.1 porin family protein [Methylobacterium sp. OTU13CASTA1]KQO68732.1 porin [Methylobacterium sp. Leaf87]KQP29458.1 porin [Methylobacterium sp. Leaf102]KQP32838.1 porin [Methylobacterium sp. Leaf100]KQP63253.1 porin [Methylobacterium sp. Leaf112]